MYLYSLAKHTKFSIQFYIQPHVHFNSVYRHKSRFEHVLPMLFLVNVLPCAQQYANYTRTRTVHDSPHQNSFLLWFTQITVIDTDINCIVFCHLQQFPTVFIRQMHNLTVKSKTAKIKGDVIQKITVKFTVYIQMFEKNVCIFRYIFVETNTSKCII